MRIKGFGIGMAVFSLLCGQVMAAGSAGGRLAMPENHENGTARVMAMGSAVVGIPQGGASLLWNPAGLGYLDRMQLSAHHNSGLGESIHELGVFGMPMGAFGGVAVNLNYLNNGTFDGRDDFGNPTSSYTAGSFGLGLGWGKRWFSNLAVGVTLRWNYQNLASTSFAAAATDLGILWAPADAITVGVTYANLGTQVSGKFLDSGLRMGVAYQVTPEMVVAASSELKPVGGFDALRFGLENWLLPMMAIRAGYVLNFTDNELNGISSVTAGLGFKIREFLLDYAVVPTGELGTSHRLSFTYQGEKQEVRMVRARSVAMTPAVASLEPNRGLEEGGTSVAIKGGGFSGATAVMFGDVHAFSFVVHSDSRITAKSPAQVGEVDVVVMSAAGFSPIVTADRFTYYVEPVPVLPPVVVVAKLIVLDDTFFDYDKSELNAAAEELLKGHILVLKENPELEICISGYASDKGTEEYNQALSERRANSVRDALIKGGIHPDRLTVVGYGKTRPANFEPIPAQTKSAAAKSNMRVLFEIGVCKPGEAK